MKLDKDALVTVVTLAGEFVGKIENVSDNGTIELRNPRMLGQNPDTGQVGFTKGISAASVTSPKSATFKDYLFVSAVNEEVEKGYIQFTSGIQLVTP